MKNIDFNKIHKIYFIGLGGIGISATCRLLKLMGKEVRGSDLAENEIVRDLRREKIAVLVPQCAQNVPPDYDLAVYTVAAPPDNVERQAAAKLGLRQITYPELLGLLMKNKIAIGIAGTDGKSTTTALTGWILLQAGLDPTIILGSKASYLKGNARLSQGRYFVFESDEYKRAFANYWPKIAAVTNIKTEHLDCYKNLAEIKSAFKNFLKRVPQTGLIVKNADDPNSLNVIKNLPAKIMTFGLKKSADLMAKDIKIKNGSQIFSLIYQNKNLGQIKLTLPARYNIYNALAAMAIALYLKIKFPVIKKAVAGFKGIWRRFEKLGRFKGKLIITDYAHTPGALSQTIAAAKEFYPGKKILFVFQPHQYSRTNNFFQEFAQSFAAADLALISDIYYVAGRENPKDFKINSQKLAQAAKRCGAKVVYGGDLKQTEKIIRKKIKDFDLAVLMGAGDIYNLAKKLVK